jgi:hypothetical protein
MFKKMLYSMLGAAAALSIGAAGAYFTTQVQVADSVIKAGTVAISTEPTSAPLSLDSLAPGTTSVRSLSVHNTGSLPADIVVTAVKKAGITDFYNALTCRVSDAETQLYDGPLSTLQTSPLRLNAGTRGDLRFEVGLPATAGNDLASDYARVSLYIDAEQSH